MKREHWDDRYAADDDLVWSSEPNRFLPPEVAGLTPGRALELACGEGRNALWLAEQGWTVTAVDFSRVGVDKGAQMAVERGVEIEWVVADLLDYEPEPGAYDLVALFYLQVPAADRAVIWPRAVAAVAPGGTFLLVGHALTNLEHGHGGPRDPAVLYMPDDVVAHLGGLQVERAEVVRRPVTLDDGSTVDALDCLVRARRPG